jgi:hypothetical protein
MNNETVRNELVNLFAGGELTEELASELEAAAAADPDLRRDMEDMKKTVGWLKADEGPWFSDGSDLRIRARIEEEEGIRLTEGDPEPAQDQYSLFLQT